MAPKRQKNAKTSGDGEAMTRPLTVTTKSPARTPIQSPRKQVVGITAAQKQALIDNLQIEVTERARKLRAQYALQVQSLRTRVELRVNRIPTALRKTNMGELLEKYVQAETSKASSVDNNRAKHLEQTTSSKARVLDMRTQAADLQKPISSNPRGTKRTSDQISGSDDKENLISSTDTALPNPKKRTKQATTTTTSKGPPIHSTVLSPKSANSRTIPLHQQSQEKKDSTPRKMSRPTSPLKPTTTSATIPLSPSKATALLSSMLSNARIPATQANKAVSSNVTNVANKSKPVTRPAKSTMTATINRQASSATTTRRKRAPLQSQSQEKSNSDTRKVSNTSTMSTTSAGTTIVKKGPATSGRGTKKAGAVTTAAVAAGRKATAAAAASRQEGRKGVLPSAAINEENEIGRGLKDGRRVLRKR